MSSSTGALLAPRLATPTPYLSTGLGFRSSQSGIGQLPHQGLVHNGLMRLDPKDCLVQLDVVYDLTR